MGGGGKPKLESEKLAEGDVGEEDDDGDSHPTASKEIEN